MFHFIIVAKTIISKFLTNQDPVLYKISFAKYYCKFILDHLSYMKEMENFRFGQKDKMMTENQICIVS